MKKDDNYKPNRAVRAKIHLVLLVAGMALGIIGALYSTYSRNASAPGRLSPENIALVNGVGISKSKYMEQLDAVRADRRSDLNREQGRQILERLIDEELLIQNALETGFANSDKSVRSALVSGVVSSILEEVKTRVPTETELKKFYADNIQLFTPDDKVVISRIVFKHADQETALKQAMQSYLRISGGLSFSKVSQSLSSSDGNILFVAAVTMPLTELREYFGPEVVAMVKQLKQGGITSPISTLSGSEIIFVNDYIHGEPPRLGDMRDMVEQTYLQVEGEKALQNYLVGLRRNATISIAE